jgi:hypothetical protein
MSTKNNKIAVEKTPAPQLQEVKLQGILLAEITLETSTKELLEIKKIKGHYTTFWIDNSGQRISDFDSFNQREEAFPLRLWRFPSERDVQNDLVDEFLSDI